MLALSIAALLLGSFLPVLDMTTQTLAGAIVYFAYRSLSRRTALMIYAGSAILGLIIVPDKIGLLMYILFFGLFALLKPVAENICAKHIGGTVNDPVIRPFGANGLRVVRHRKLVIAAAYVLKTLIAAVLLALVFAITFIVAGLDESMTVLFVKSEVGFTALLSALVLTFFLYDYLLWLIADVLGPTIRRIARRR